MSDTVDKDAFQLLRFETGLSDARNFRSSESDGSVKRRKISSHKSSLVCTQSAGSDCSSDAENVKSSKSDMPFPQKKTASYKSKLNTTQSPKSDFSSSASRKRKLKCIPLCDDAFQKSSNDCELMLRQIIRTAYQFSRHSHREKLTLKNLEKAFKIHNIDMKPDDVDSIVDQNDIESLESGNESQPFTCTSMWLRKA